MFCAGRGAYLPLFQVVVFFLQAEEQQNSNFSVEQSSLNQRQAQCSSGELFLQFVTVEDSTTALCVKYKNKALNEMVLLLPTYTSICLVSHVIHEVISVTYLVWLLNQLTQHISKMLLNSNLYVYKIYLSFCKKHVPYGVWFLQTSWQHQICHCSLFFFSHSFTILFSSGTFITMCINDKGFFSAMLYI